MFRFAQHDKNGGGHPVHLLKRPSYCFGMCNRKYESRSERVTSPRNLSSSITRATRPRSNTSKRSLIVALGESVSSLDVIAFLTGSLKCKGSRCTFTSTSDSSIIRSEEHTSELQSPYDLVCRLL